MSRSGDKLSVFISYARRDASAFAEDLLAGLEAAGFDPFLDRHDIAAGEDWEARLDALLNQADTVVFVLSPASVGSERCGWELARAQALSKRIIPVVAEDVADADTPEGLRRLNYIFFSKGHSFAVGLRTLSEALRTDVDWIREHTRLAELAARWRAQGEIEAALLRGTELAAALDWMKRWTAGAPEPSDLHRAFLNASSDAEAARTSEERRKLEAIAAAQAERETALLAQGRAQRRTLRVMVVMGAVTALLLGGVVFALTRLQGALAEVATADERIAELESREADLNTQIAQLEARQEEAAAATEQAVESLQERLEQLPEGAIVAPPPSARMQTPEAAPRAAVDAATRAIRVAAGWDVDVFACAGRGYDEHRALAQRIEAALTAESERQLAAPANEAGPFPIGRVRVRDISERVNARSSYQVSGNVVSASADEREAAAALIALLSRAGLPGGGGEAFTVRTTTSNTPYYVSVFACASAAP